MWAAHRTVLREGWHEKVAITEDGRTMSFAEVIAGWRDDAAFRAFFLAALGATAYPAFFWEMPPIKRGQTGLDYEYVAIRSSELEHTPPDDEAFAEKFRNSVGSVAAFRNLGGDALLVVPRQICEAEAYTHIAAFVREAPPAQQREFFRVLGLAIGQELRRTAERIWISTSGLGVAWLHVRLDSYPKYYQHRPYASL